MLILPCILSVGSVFLIYEKDIIMQIFGVFFLSLFFVQCFILLHECAHLNFFKSKKLNEFFGHFFGLLSLIPFYTWQQMHNLHHKWTGWRDMDPTTEGTTKPSDIKFIRFLVNIFWWLFIPVFFLSYQLDNYWNPVKLKRFLPSDKFSIAKFHLVAYAIFLLAFLYLTIVYIPAVLYAFLLSLIWKELIIMTQHSHVDIPLANGLDVKPISYKDQIPYTRSFRTRHFIDRYLLFNFNEHKIHHAQPGLPCYFLDEYQGKDSIQFLHWLVIAKRMTGVDYIFRTKNQTGVDI